MGRGSAKATMALVFVMVVLSCLVFEIQPAQAAFYTVGGPSGWTFNVDTWPKGKNFKAGDVLVFNYDGTQHNVVQVDRRGYTGCTSNKGAKVLQSGKDRVKLAKGHNYFICTFTGHCQSGMKIAINAM
ncbi:hypothetical protein V2J09_007397 [Rumex salicifolius]